jgi:uncharacterized protein
MRSAAPIALLVAVALFPTLAAWLYFGVWANTPWMRPLYAGSKLVQAALPLVGWWALRMERGAGWSRQRGAAFAGVASGAVLGGVIVAAYLGPLGSWAVLAAAPSRILATLLALDAATPARYLALAVGLSVVHSLFEEYYWRWFLLGQLATRMSYPAALTLASLAFASHHWIVVDSYLGGAHRWSVTLPVTLLIAATGAFWGWLFGRYRSLLAPWLSHLLVDAAVMTVGWAMLWGSD